MEFLYDIKSKIISIYEMVCRMCFWAWHMRNNYDWDYGYFEQMMLLKLKRMKYCMDTDPYHMNINDLKEQLADSNTDEFNRKWAHDAYRAQKALIYVITLFERLCNDEYYDKKVGIPEHRDNIDLFKDLFNKSAGDTPYWKKTFELRELAEKLQESDRKKAYHLLHKYSRYWWT